MQFKRLLGKCGLIKMAMIRDYNSQITMTRKRVARKYVTRKNIVRESKDS